MKATYRLVFARKGIRKDGKGKISLQVYLDRNRRPYIDTGITCTPDEWDKKKGAIKPLDALCIKKQHHLNNMVSLLENYEMDLLRDSRELSVEDVKTFFKKDHVNTFNDFCEQELKSDTSLKKQTKKLHKVTLGKFLQGCGEVKFHDITYDVIKGFDNYLRGEGLAVNTIADHHKIIRRYIRIAVNRGKVKPSQNPYGKSFKVRREKTKRVYLEEHELSQLELLDYIPLSKMDKIRDLFLFCCYTGLRYQDMQNLQQDHLQKTPDGYEIAMHRMIKVAEPVFLPLHDLFSGKPEEILMKYLELSYKLIFPRITNQKGNEYLKVLGEKSGIKKRLTWHVARHTFGSLLAAKTNDPYLIMKLMGHQEIKTSMIYIHQNDSMIRGKVKKIQW